MRPLPALLVIALLLPFSALKGAGAAPPGALPAFGASAIAEGSGAPVFTLQGRPFFVYGAAFFYERLPPEAWRPAMAALKYRLHVNTLDLYVPWNWHELSDGAFDFDGHTNPRRDLRRVLRLAREFGFALVVRPGPVIRNEWRNGGYPAWLLQRSEYGMPLRDRLEGRYPPTATLQNAHSDAAAAQWLRNRTHLRYAARWLETALRQFAPVADRVVAVALDDDQGAYIDNQSWPAPHLTAYLAWLRARVARVTGGRVPVFINTYQMKVTAASPVWAMGNWYQSDAYAIGEHDRVQLEFSTALLQTRPHQPLMASEFQAGWLQQPEDVLPQAADPSNTSLALHTLLALGARGVINFPAQDTLYPAGYEVPFANAFYAWDAALGYGGATSRPRFAPSPRARPTALAGAEIATFNPLLAAARVANDAAIVWLPSAYDAATLTNADVAALAERTMTAQRYCRRVRLTCALVDLRFEPPARLRGFPLLIVPLPAHGALTRRPLAAQARAALAAYGRSASRAPLGTAQPSAAALATALSRTRHLRYVTGADGTFAEDRATGAGFLTLVNYDGVAHRYARAAIRTFGGRRYALPAFTVPARTGVLLPLAIPLRYYDPHFAREDRFWATCPVVRIARSPAMASGGVTLDLANAARGCRIEARIAGGLRAYDVRETAARVALSPRGMFVDQSARRTARDAAFAPSAVTLPLRGNLRVAEPPLRPVAAHAAIAYASDVYRDGEGAIVLENALVRVVVSPHAGARAFVFEDKARVTNAFTTVGALRDDVLVPPPPSSVDRIGKYTNQMPAGFFNRDYRPRIESSGARAAVRLWYDAPDAYPSGAHFERVLRLAPQARCFRAELRARFEGGSALARRQRAVSVTSLAVGNPRESHALLLLDGPRPLRAVGTLAVAASQRGLGLYDAATRELALAAWTARSTPVRLIGRTNSLLLRIALAPGSTNVLSFAYENARDAGEAAARAARFAKDGCGEGLLSDRENQHAYRGKWRNGLRDRLKSG